MATDAQIKAAYRRAALEHHPDKHKLKFKEHYCTVLHYSDIILCINQSTTRSHQIDMQQNVKKKKKPTKILKN